MKHSLRPHVVVSNHKALALVAVAIGFVAGLATGYRQWHSAPTSETERAVSALRQTTGVKQQSTPATNQEVQLANGLQRALDAIEVDAKTNKLSTDQATKLRARLHKAASEKQSLLESSDDNGTAERALQQSWKKWAADNGLPYRYFTRL